MSSRPPRWVITAFAVGAGVHLVLLALAFGPAAAATIATPLLLVVALPGALVDVSAEMIQPSGLGAAALVVAASALNGAAYVGLSALFRWVDRARAARAPAPHDEAR